MENEEPFQLIRSKDPTKIKVTIRERFAKLTLSSNKKQNPQNVVRDHEQLKRKKVSRNLTDELDGEKNAECNKENIVKIYINPLLLSDDSTHLEDITNESLNLTELSVNNSISKLKPEEQVLLIEPAQEAKTTGNTIAKNNNENVIHELSQQISCITLVEDVEDKRIENEGDKIETKIEEEEKEEANESFNNSCLIISLSDSSESSVNEYNWSYDRVTSAIPESGNTANALLPNTFSNDKADRMDGFLRDVSFQLKEIEQRRIKGMDDNQPVNLDSILQIDKAEGASNDALNALVKSAQLKIADTESMSVSLANESASKTRSLDVTPVSLDNSVVFDVASHSSLVDQVDQVSRPSVNVNTNSRRLASNNTEENTLRSNDSKSFLHSIENSINAVDESIIYSSENSLPLPNDSLTISETSVESNNLENSTDKNNKLSNEAVNSIIQNSLSSQLSEMKINVGSVSISAKFNIKIRINDSGSDSSHGNENINNNDDDDQEDKTKENTKSLSSTEPNQEENSPNSFKNSSQMNEILKSATSDQETDINSTNDDELISTPKNKNGNENENFMTQAEKLLNELYGKTWQTPDVLRSLKGKNQTHKSNAIKSHETPTTSNRHTKDDGNDKNLRRQALKNNFTTTESKKKSTKSITKIPKQSNLKSPGNNVANVEVFPMNNINESEDKRKESARGKKTNATIRSPRNIDPFKPTSTIRKIEKNEVTSLGAAPTFKTPKNLHFKSPALNDKYNEVFKSSIEKPEKLRNVKKTATSSKTTSLNHKNIEIISSEDESDCPEEKTDEISSIRTKKYSVKANSKTNKESSIGDFSKFRLDVANMDSTHITSSSAEPTRKNAKAKNNISHIYLDLTTEQVAFVEDSPTLLENPESIFQNSPPQTDETESCSPKTNNKINPITPKKAEVRKRRLFNVNFGCDSPGVEELIVPSDDNDTSDDNDENDFGVISRSNGIVSFRHKVNILNTEFDTTTKPIFRINGGYTPTSSKKCQNTPKTFGKIYTPTPTLKKSPKTPLATKTLNIPFKTPSTVDVKKYEASTFEKFFKTPANKQCFLYSLDVRVSKSHCHPQALVYRDNYAKKKKELTELLYHIYNSKLFHFSCELPLVWNKKLLNTAGRCTNQRKSGIRVCQIDLSEKVLTSPDRLRCTLMHEMCHAAAWIYDSASGHGVKWKSWTKKVSQVFPELPKIGVCHAYDIQYKYTFKCMRCHKKAQAHSKAKKSDFLHCSTCFGKVEVFLNKKDKDGNIKLTPIKSPTGFAKFVKENYKKFKKPNVSHADVMKILSKEYAAAKNVNNLN